MKNIKKVLKNTYQNPEARRNSVPLFIGNPGLGKTVLIEAFAKEKGVNLVELITSQMSPFEISGIAMPDKDSKKMTYFNFDKLENLKDGDILFFDEVLNGNPIVLNACLTILEQRRFISGKPLPDIMIIGAANPQGMSPLTPQIKERFIWHSVKFDQEMWVEYMKGKYFITPSIGRKLSGLIQTEKFIDNNFYTPRSIDKAVNMIINDIPTPYEDVIRPILEEIIENKMDESVTLDDGKKLEKNEMMTWLDLIRVKFNASINEPIKEKVKPSVFKLPEYWYIKITKANFDYVYDNYYRTKGVTWGKDEGYGLSDNEYTSAYWKNEFTDIPSKYKRISIADFKKHVVNK